MQIDFDQDLTLVWCSQTYLVNYVLPLKLWYFYKTLMYELRYILLVFLEVGKTKFWQNDYTRNGQGTFYNEKLGPKLAQNQKRCKFTPLALATKLNLMIFSSSRENIHLLEQAKKCIYFCGSEWRKKNGNLEARKNFFFKFLKGYCHVLTQVKP